MRAGIGLFLFRWHRMTRADTLRDLDWCTELAPIPVRLLASWKESTRGRYDWGDVDAFAQRMAQKGLGIHWWIDGTPPWARNNVGNYQSAPTDLDAFSRFVEELVKRSNPTVVEPYNECDLLSKGPWAPADYANVMKAARAGIAAAPEPSPLLVNPGWATIDEAKLRGILNGGGRDMLPFLDAWNEHYYAPNASEAKRVVGLHRRLLTEFGYGELPIMCTEIGKSSARGLQAQASYVRDVLPAPLEAGATASYLALLRNHTELRGFKDHGILYQDWRRKPAWDALLGMVGTV